MREFYRGGCDGLKYEMLKHQCTTSFPSVGGGWEGMKLVGCHIRYVELLIREKKKSCSEIPMHSAFMWLWLGVPTEERATPSVA